MLRALALAALLCVATVPTAAQTPAGAAGSLTDVTGVWTMLVAGHQIGLELEQKGTKVEGVMLAMGRRVLLVGDYVERIQLADSDPLAHGLTIQGDTLWYCDDVGVICRMALRA